MSVTTVAGAMGRISVAEEESPIAIFLTSKGRIEATFATTVYGQRRLKDGYGLVGVFDKYMNPKSVREKLVQALRNVHHLQEQAA